MYSQAIEEYKVESQISGDRDEADYVAAMQKGFRSGGWQGALARGIEVLKEQRKTGNSSAYWIASSYAELGDKEHAFGWLNTAFQEHEEYLLGLKTDPSFGQIRSDPRFSELVRKVGLPQ
jgi:hypothetical protein